MRIRFRLITKVMLGFVLISVAGAITSAIVATQMISKSLKLTWMGKIRSDLHMANHLFESQAEALRVSLERREWVALEALHRIQKGERLEDILGKFREDLDLDFLAYLEGGSKGLGRAPEIIEPLGSLPLIGKARAGNPAAGIVDLANRAPCPYKKGASSSGPVQTLGFVAAVPVRDETLQVVGVLLGIRCLGRGGEKWLDLLIPYRGPHGEREGWVSMWKGVERVLHESHSPRRLPLHEEPPPKHLRGQILAEGREWVGILGKGKDAAFLGFIPVRDLEGRIVGTLSMGLPLGPYRHLRDRLLLTFLLMAFGGICLILMVSAVVARKLVRPMEALIQGIDRIAEGDFTHRVPITTQDEIGKLAAAYNRMSASLQHKDLELNRSTTFLENVIDSSVDGIIAADMKGNIIIFNQGAERMLGYQRDEAIGKVHTTALYSPGVAKEVMRRLRSEEYGGRGRLDKMEVEAIRNDGEQVPVYISAALVYEGPKEVASVGIFTDLRERKRLEQQLLRSEKLSSLGGLAAGIAHELNQPLTGILTFTHMLLKRFKENEELTKDLEVIERETGRCARIIRGVLEFARERPPEKVPTDLNELVVHTLSLVEHQAIFLDIQVIKELEPNMPPAMVDPDQMEQVIINLLINAADAMADMGGTLWIKTRKVGQFAELEMSDTGGGIPEKDLVRIFDPFFTTKGEKKGMGLGLSVSYGIVRSHLGEIQVHSEIGKGTTFTIRLPLLADNGEVR